MKYKLEEYPDYQEAALPWINTIPVSWNVKRAKSLFSAVDSRSQLGSEELLTVSSSDGIRKRSEKAVTMFQASSYAGHKLCWPGDLVVNSLWAWATGLGFSRYHGIVSTAYSVYRLRPELADDFEYFHNLFRSRVYDWEFTTRSKGIWISRLQLTDQSFFDMPVLLPPSGDRKAIVRFIHYIDHRVNRLLKTKRRLIELLNEQKQAIIHRAVTRGLDPNVPLKPSGGEWLGDIPAHWEVRKLRYIATKFGSGVTPRGGSQIYVEEGIPFLRSQNIQFTGLRLDVVAKIPRSIHEELSGTHVKSGDVLLNITGASIGRVCFVPDTFNDGNVSQHVCIIRPRITLAKPSFIAAVMSSSAAQYQLYLSQNGSSREGLTLRAIKGFTMLLPSLKEQDQILNAIATQTKDIIAATDKAQSEINYIREYRTRLVADVVTGQLDVRGLALPENDAEEIRSGNGGKEIAGLDEDEANDDEPEGAAA